VRYAEMLKSAIEKRKYSLSQVIFRLAKSDICMDKAVLSKLQNGKLSPAKDDVNIALAGILEIDPTKFRLAAAREMIDPELYELIRTAG